MTHRTRARRAVLLGAALALGVGGAPRPARAAEWALRLDNRLYAEALPVELLYSMLRFPGSDLGASERLAYQAHLYARGAARPADALGLELGIDTGLLELGPEGVSVDGRALADRAKETLFLGETFAELQLGASGVAALRAGKLRPRLGDGALFDAYALGLEADVDLSLVEDDSPWRFRAYVLLPDATLSGRGKTNPLIDLEVGLESGGGSSLRLLGAVFFDNENGLAPLLGDALFRGRIGAAARAVEQGQPERDPLADRIARRLRLLSSAYDAGVVGYAVDSAGVLGWVGLLGRLQASPFALRATVLAGLGQVTLNAQAFGLDAFAPQCDATRAACATLRQAYYQRLALPSTPTSVGLRSMLVDVTARMAVHDRLGIDAFGLLMSGDEGFSADTWVGGSTYHSFIGLAPFLDHSLIFFRGGVAGSLASPLVASIAPDGAGLAAVGAGLTVLPLERLRVRANGALLYALVPSVASQARRLGAELDLWIDAELADFLSLSGSAGLFAAGPYYGALPLGWQAIASITLRAAQL